MGSLPCLVGNTSSGQYFASARNWARGGPFECADFKQILSRVIRCSCDLLRCIHQVMDLMSKPLVLYQVYRKTWQCLPCFVGICLASAMAWVASEDPSTGAGAS